MNSGSKHSLILLPVRALVISLFPVLCGCEPALISDSIFTAADRPAVKAAGLSEDNGQIRNLDILVFNDDLFQKLDCYQRVEEYNHDILNIGSQSGKKPYLSAQTQYGTETVGWTSPACLTLSGRRQN